MNIDALNRWILPLKIKIMGLVRFGNVNSFDDTGTFQSAQVETMRDVVKDNVPRIQNYGFSSNPQPGSEAIVVNVGADQSGSVIIACENRQYRFKGLNSGEVVMYTDEGDKIHFQRGRIIDIETGTLTINATTAVNITSPKVSISKDVSIGGNSTIAGNESIGGNVAITGNETITGSSTATGGYTTAATVKAATVATGALTGSAGGALATDISTTGNVSGGGTSLAAIKSGYDAHTHNVTAVGSPTGPATPQI